MTPTPTVERVAEAVHEAANKAAGQDEYCSYGMALAAARAAIEAMRLNDDDWMHRDIVGNYDDLERFNWTIDAILNEKKK